MHISVNQIVTCRVPKYYLNQLWHIVKYTIKDILGQLCSKSKRFTHEFAFLNVAYEIAVILFMPQCVTQQWNTSVAPFWWNGKVIISLIKCGINFFHSKTSMVAPLNFGNELLISSHTHWACDYLSCDNISCAKYHFYFDIYCTKTLVIFQFI